MFEKLKATEEKFEDISNRLTDPEVIGDNGLYAKLMKEYKSLSPIVEKYREYCSYVKTEQEAQEMLDESGADRELKDLARAELDEARENIASVSEELKILLIPKDPNDDRNVIVEIRGGAGGDEASLFANSLFRMYSMYAEARGWKIDVLNANPTELGASRKYLSASRVRVHIHVSNTKAAFTVFSEFPRPSPRDVSTPPPLPLRCFPKRTMWSWK